ncbi:MAG: efflux RND transporter permease subunit [Pseudomonadota bacterium]
MAARDSQGVSGWFLHNPTAANLLMVVLIVAGVIAIFTMRQEVFPLAVLDTIEIRADYRGATAAEVEAQVVQPMEQSINTLRDIRTVVSEVRSGGANIFVMLQQGSDAQRALDEIRSAVDGINTLPLDLDPPAIVQVRDDGGEMDIGFYGFASRDALHDFAEKTRARLLALEPVGQVEVDGAVEPEITVRVSPDRARLFGLSLSDVAQQIRRATLDLSGGAIRSSTGDYGLSTGLDRRYADEFADIALVQSGTGVPLSLSQIARIEDGFRPHGKRYRINGERGVMMTVFGAGGATPAEVSTSVRELLAEIEAEMPAGGVVVLDDDAQSYVDRVGILADSAFIGLALVLGLLFLVLEARVAFWVATGLPVAMLGGVALFALTPYTINFVSIFSFVIVIGVVVDDAVVIGESIYSGIEAGLLPLDAAADTLSRFSPAITLAIATNIIAFAPILFMPGELGLFLVAIPVVTACVFAMSLVEALWILPSHLAYGRYAGRTAQTKTRWLPSRLNDFRKRRLIPALRVCLNNASLVIAIGLLVAGVVFSWAFSGRMPIALQPAFESQQVTANFALNPGASERQVDDMATGLAALGQETLAGLGNASDIKGSYLTLGEPVSHQGAVTFTLADGGDRLFTAGDFATRWRQRIGQPVELTQLSIDYLQGPGDGRDLTVELAHANQAVSRRAAESLVEKLRHVAGVEQISYSGNAFRSEIRFELTSAGRALGFDESEISSRLRAQLDGLEALRLARGNNEVRVMIRGDHAATDVLPDLDNIILTSSQGRQVALGDIANIRWERGAVQLRRINGQRIERVEASIDRSIVAKGLIDDLVSDVLLPELEADYPGLLTWDEALDTNEDAETATSLLVATAAMLVGIFVLIGGYVRSLRRGAILLIALPLSAAGALLGHIVLGIGLSAASFLGVLALGGLVINSGLLLNLRYTEARAEGNTAPDAMIIAVGDRFRPIVLSSVTTLLGLAPLIFSASTQAAALRPVAVSVGFGMLFSIPVILILLPCIVVATEVARSPRATTTALGGEAARAT